MFKPYFNKLIFMVNLSLFNFIACATTAENTEVKPTTDQVDTENIEVIVVTGSRQQSKWLTFTGNIDKLSAEDIALVSAVQPSDLLNRATAVHVQSNNGMESLPAIRSPVLTGPGAAGAFLFLEDGIATRAAGFANNNALAELNLAQAQKIEIIRGPASAVYGSNAVHGVINVLTKAPSNNSDMSIIVGPNDRYQLQGTLGKGSEKQGFSANIQAVDDGGYRDNSGFSSIKLGLRHDYTQGDDRFKTVIAGFMLDQNTAGFISSRDNAANNNNSNCYRSSYADENLYKDRNAMKKNCDSDAYRQWSSVRIATSWQRDLSRANSSDSGEEHSFTLTPYFRINQMEFRQHYLPSKAIEKNSHYSIGMNSNYNWQLNQQLALVMGIDLDWTQGELSQTQQQPDSYSWGKARQQGLQYNYKVTAATIAPYFQSDWQVNEQLTMTASMRFDAIQYRYDNLIANGTTKADGSFCVNQNNAPVACLYQRPSDRDNNFNNTSSKLGLNYRLSNNMAFFTTWSQGFRAPQTTDMYRLQNQQTIGDINSERLDSIELGLRGISKQLTYEVAVYTMNKENFFFRDADGLNVTDGKTSHQGIELSVDYSLTDNLSLAINYSYAQNYYEFDRASSGIIKGNEVDTAPQQQGNVRLAWQASESTAFELEWLHMGQYYLDPANQHKYAGHNLLQLRSTMQVNNRISLFARIENLTDEKYASRADYAFGAYRFFGGQPRALHLGINASF